MNCNLQLQKLFHDLMVPEWGLAIFMKRFGMTRNEALACLKKQDDELIELCNMTDM